MPSKETLNIVILGIGEVGGFLCQELVGQGHAVTAIDTSSARLSDVDERLDVRTIEGAGTSAATLRDAGVMQADYFLAMTDDDSVNMLASSIAKALGTKKTICRIHDETLRQCEHFNYQHRFEVDYFINPEELCALEFARAIRTTSGLIVESFARGCIQVQHAQVIGQSKHANRSLASVNFGPDVRIAYIQRGDEMVLPRAQTKILGDDILALVGDPNILQRIAVELNPNYKMVRRSVTFFGGTETAVALARLLSGRRFQLRIIERDKARCEALTDRLEKVTVIHGNATRRRLLEEEDVGKTDFFVACTKDDEDNIMTALQVKKLGAQHVQLLINKPDYEALLDELQVTLGIELALSPRVATVTEVMRLLSPRAYRTLAPLPGDVGQLVEIRVPIGSGLAGKKIREVPWPSRCTAVGLQHKYRAKLPGADDTVLAGDTLLVVTPNDQTQALLKIFE